MSSSINIEIIEKSFKGYYVAALTDEYKIGIWPVEDDFDLLKLQDKILELRIFSDTVEYKWSRGNIGEDFSYRKLTDEEDKYEKPIEELQILDIDLSRDKNYNLPGVVKMSKGGSFYLPLSNISNGNVCVKVKYYIPKYDSKKEDTVHSYVADWRLSGFEEVKNNG